MERLAALLRGEAPSHILPFLWMKGCLLYTSQKGFGVAVYSDGSDSVRLQKDPRLSPEAVVNDRDGRMHFTGDWHRMEDACGNYRGTETLSRCV